MSDIIKSFENSKFTLYVLIDLMKAFDTVNHDILLTKLGPPTKEAGGVQEAIPPLFLRSYFTGDVYVEICCCVILLDIQNFFGPVPLNAMV